MEHIYICIVTNYVMNHIENNKILYELQNGFRHNRPCETQLLSFIQELSETDNKNIQTDLKIMDFAKAFDKVPHRRLLYKLNYNGISGPTLHWISTFLTYRTQTVMIDGKSSSKNCACHIWCSARNSPGPRLVRGHAYIILQPSSPTVR